MFGANVCMWVGLVLIAGIDAELLINHGPDPVLLYNPDTYIIFLGAVVVCFEGIGLVLPLRESMEPHMQVQQLMGVLRCGFYYTYLRVFALCLGLGALLLRLILTSIFHFSCDAVLSLGTLCFRVRCGVVCLAAWPPSRYSAGSVDRKRLLAFFFIQSSASGMYMFHTVSCIE